MHSDKFRSARPAQKPGAVHIAGPTPADPVQRASRRIRSVDALGTEASGSTVDTDGKTQDALRDASPWQDNVIYSNACLDNAIPEPDPDAPIAGIDSRPAHGRPAIATMAGHHVVWHGAVDQTVRSSTRVAQRFTLEDDAPAGKTGQHD